MPNNLLILISSVLFIASIYNFGGISATKKGRIFFSSTVLVFLILTAFFIVSNYFTGKGIDESVIYHLRYGLSGAGFGEYLLIIIISLVFLVLAFIASYAIYKKTGKTKNPEQLKSKNYLSYLCISAAIFINPASMDIMVLTSTGDEGSFFEYYQKPQIIKRPEIKKNFVYIYAESLERTYFDESIFPGLIKNLRDLESNSTYFTNISDVSGSGWTIAGITASQCGIPLVTPSHGNSMAGMDKFLKSADCLGDLLKKEGYKLSYLGGASLDFGGKGKFFSTHGFEDVRGLAELSPTMKDKTYQTQWGLYDDSLLSIALDQFNNLSKAKKPFGLFLLTLDTHFPYGHPSNSCNGITYKDGSNSILNAVACSDDLIGNFVKTIRNSPYAENTEIIIASDHLSMKNTASSLLAKGDRKNLFMVVSPNSIGPHKVDKKGTTLDIAPTLLNILGYDAKVGLGRNLLGSEASLIDQVENINKKIRGWKEALISFWDFPRVKNGIEINIEKEIVKLDDRELEIPILIEFNSKLETTIKFEHDLTGSQKTLLDHIMGLNPKTPFLWVGKCSSVPRMRALGLCVFAGKLGRPFILEPVDKVMDISLEQLNQLVLM
ncbi:MAG: sulfatase-like hydrolase/transferase [Proteobacteria bacterium]|nr:sulfatase-like hydrolase/transferase [Pseudomonadota bacterium]